jgi:hypothetical protein
MSIFKKGTAHVITAVPPSMQHKDPPPAPVPVHVVVFGPNGIVMPESARLVLDDGTGYQGVNVGPQVHFTLPTGTQYGWGASLLIVADDVMHFHERITLAPDINVRVQSANVTLPRLVANGQFLAQDIP